jgi:hypothetical protein
VEVRRFCQVAPAGIGLIGVAHRSDWCSPAELDLLVPLRFRVGLGGCWFLGPVALQWLHGLVQLV